MAKSKNKKSFGFLSYIILLLLMAGVIGFVSVFTNGFTESLKSFYVTHDSKMILSKQENLLLMEDTPNRFNVNYTFSKVNKKQNTDYSVQIIANSTYDFEFTVDGILHSFSGERDYTECFTITLYDDYFTLQLDKDVTIESILSKKYSGKVVKADVKYYEDYFLLLVYSYNKELLIEIGFHPPIPVEIIDLDKNGIIF